MAFQLLIPLAMAALGTFQAVNTYGAQKDKAKAMADQAKVKRDAEARQIALDSRAEAAKVNSERDKNRRHRENMLAQYATSGVLIDGSASQVLQSQREIDELNVQRVHQVGNDQRRLDAWRSETDFKQSMYAAKSTKRAATTGLITDLGMTALSFGMDAGMFSTAGNSMWGMKGANTIKSTTMAGQSLNTKYLPTGISQYS